MSGPRGEQALVLFVLRIQFILQDENSVVCKHTVEMRSFCLRCGIKESTLSDEYLVSSYRIIDKYLSRLGKCRTPIKRDGHRLPRAVLKGLKGRGQLNEFVTYKHLVRATVQEITGKSESLYFPWLVDDKEETLNQLMQYEDEKKYTSNIVDIFLKALATICSSAIIAYFPKEDEVSNHIFYPTSETETTSSIEITFVGGHCDLIPINYKLIENRNILNSRSRQKSQKLFLKLKQRMWIRKCAS